MESRQRWGLVAAGWWAYALYYVGRANLSIAVPGLESESGFGPAEVGVFVAGFFGAYSVTQVFVGRMSDRIGARWLVGAGLVGSGLMNILFVVSNSFVLAMVAWTLNGVFQGIGWPPLIAGVSRWVTGVKASQVSAAFGTSYVAGTVLALALGGVLVAWGGISTLFFAAGIFLIAVGIAWWIGIRDPMPERAPRKAAEGSMNTALWLLPPAALAGVAWMTLAIWTPAYLIEVHDFSIEEAGFSTAAMAAVSLPVMLVVGVFFRSPSGGRPAQMVAAVLAVTAISIAAIPISSTLIWAVAVIFIATALANASSSVVLGFLPKWAAPNGIGFASGVLSLGFSVGGGAGALVVGHLISIGSWSTVFYLSAGCALMSAAWVLELQRRSAARSQRLNLLDSI